MIQKIHLGNLNIYTSQIINKESFLKLYNEENILGKFDTRVTTSSHHPFATLISKSRGDMQVKIGEVIVSRIYKENKKFEFPTKIRKWGKFSIPKEAIRTLNIKNHEKISFEVIRESKKLGEKEKKDIDLSKIKTIK